MNKVISFEQFTNIINEIKKKATTVASNWHFYRDYTEKVIEQQRLYYNLSENVFHIYLDQGAYYKYYLVADTSKHVLCKREDKPLFSYYMHSGESGSSSPIESILLDNGFDYKGSLRGYDVDPSKIITKSDALANVALEILKSSGYRLYSPSVNNYDSVLAFLGTIKEMPYWQIDYRSEDEIVNDILSGCMMCINDKNDDLCAAVYSFPVGKVEYGWIAVSPAHRRGGILSVILSNEKMKGMLKRGHTGRGWIDVNNSSSVSYHENLGYVPNGRYREEYILE